MTSGRKRGVLFISNGHGEDLIAARIISRLPANGTLLISALPVVGKGRAYEGLGVGLIDEGREMPSGGFICNGPRNLAMDLRAGLLAQTRRQIKALKEASPRTDLAVCVGDCLLLILAGRYLRRPIIFVPTAKSDYVAPHWRIERWLMRHYCTRVFPRDALTARSLAGHGIPAEFLGNVMMDALDYTDGRLPSPPNAWRIGILPGSRLEAYLNMEDLARATLALHALSVSQAADRRITFLVALAGGLSFSALAGNLAPAGWSAEPLEQQTAVSGLQGYLVSRRGGDQPRLAVLQERFADIIAASDVVLGLAGTANEQAVGLGKPVVTFVGRGPQFTTRFLNTQKKLLDGAISVVTREPRAIADEVYSLLFNQTRRETMAGIGRERMGPPGGAGRIAGEIVKFIKGL